MPFSEFEANPSHAALWGFKLLLTRNTLPYLRNKLLIILESLQTRSCLVLIHRQEKKGRGLQRMCLTAINM